MTNWPDKDPAETITVTFDFSALAETLVSATVETSVARGLPDPAPAAILSGSPSVQGALVMQRIAAGQAGTTYALRCLANDADGEVHVLVAALPIATARPR